jgi:hypothetical protein
MTYRVLTIDEKEEWSVLLERLPIDQQDIYYTPDYYELYEKNGYGKAMCFVFRKNDSIALYPFLMNSVNDLGYDLDVTYFDIQGAYGYNGAVTLNDTISFKNEFDTIFKEFCADSNIIAEFTRFNPILNNHQFFDDQHIIKSNKDIIVDLKHTENDIWGNIYAHSVRKNVKKAIRSGLTVKHFSGNEISESWFRQFITIYSNTLNRRSADDYYYFSDKYFSFLNKKLGNNILYFFTLKNDDVISCELVTFKNYNAYSFLGGTLSEYFPYRPNDILKHEIIHYLKSIGVKYFCLGGGAKEDDGIYKYKKSFSKDGEVNFYIGTKVHNQNIYDDVCGRWTKKYSTVTNQHSNMLLKYRGVK